MASLEPKQLRGLAMLIAGRAAANGGTLALRITVATMASLAMDSSLLTGLVLVAPALGAVVLRPWMPEHHDPKLPRIGIIVEVARAVACCAIAIYPTLPTAIVVVIVVGSLRAPAEGAFGVALSNVHRGQHVRAVNALLLTAVLVVSVGGAIAVSALDLSLAASAVLNGACFAVSAATLLLATARTPIARSAETDEEGIEDIANAARSIASLATQLASTTSSDGKHTGHEDDIATVREDAILLVHSARDKLDTRSLDRLHYTFVAACVGLGLCAPSMVSVAVESLANFSPRTAYAGYSIAVSGGALLAAVVVLWRGSGLAKNHAALAAFAVCATALLVAGEWPAWFLALTFVSAYAESELVIELHSQIQACPQQECVRRLWALNVELAVVATIGLIVNIAASLVFEPMAIAIGGSALGAVAVAVAFVMPRRS